MKKLALMLPAMRMGGAEIAALNFLPCLMKHFEVTVVLNKLEGELLNRLPEGIRVIEDRLLDFKTVVRYDVTHFRIKWLIRDIRYYTNVKKNRKKDENYRYLISRTPYLSEHFDIAIGYVANVSTQIFSLADRTSADIKIAWIHGETSELHDTELFNRIYMGFDRIYAVSKKTREHFLDRFPGCREKTDVYYNRINKENILCKSNEPICDIKFSTGCLNIVSVGRLSPEKGFTMVPDIALKLKEHGYKIKWYIIGDGPCRNDIEGKIRLLNLSDSVYLIGNRKNPYPYVKACDIYVQPSYEEGFVLTVCEAVVLCKPIVCTIPAALDGILKDGISAVVTGSDADELCGGIKKLIDDSCLMGKMVENVSEIDIANMDDINMLIDFVRKQP